MKKIIIIFSLFILSLTLFSLNIRLGTIAPKGSPWDKALKQLSIDIKRISNGKINLKIYSGGIVGDEEVLIRKMKLRQLDAAAITVYGMNQISKGILALSSPMLIRNYDQLQYVLNDVGPIFEKQIEEQRFVILTWTFAGWMHFFSSQSPILVPNDLKTKKMLVLKENQLESQTWKSAGFNPIPISASDVTLGLQSGKIDTFATPTTSAAASQWFGISNYMSEMNWAPMIAGIVINKSVWDKIPNNMKNDIKIAAQKTGKQISDESIKLEQDAINTMKEYGLITYKSKPEYESLWELFVEKYFQNMINIEIGIESYQTVKESIMKYKGQ